MALEVLVDSSRVRRSTLRTVAIIFFASGAAMGTLAFQHAYFSWDLELTRSIQSLLALDQVMWFVSWLGADWVPYLYVVATGLTFHFLKRHRWAVVIWIGVGGSALMNRSMKVLVNRQRPHQDLVDILIEYPNESFPSGHVVLFLTYFGFLACLAANSTLPRVVKGIIIFLAIFLILLVGPSRIYVGAHWPSDVVGGYCFGAGWLVVMILLDRRMKESQRE